jgi:ribonucleoside-triphosphate reductase
LQRAWHENNEFLRLCGVGVTGIAQCLYADDAGFWSKLRAVARQGAFEMADELGLPSPKAVTTVKPSGTLSKIMDTTEGAHTPLGRYIFNNVRFSKHDPLVERLRKANYRVFDDPTSPDAVLVTFPVAYEGVKLAVVDGKEVNLESAVEQLERYRLLMEHYVDHNCSITVSYSPEEVPEIIAWFKEHWNRYVGVSFIYRNDPTKTAADLGYLYLPQEVVTREVYEEYVRGLKRLGTGFVTEHEDDKDDGQFEIDTGSECAGGVCPIR